MDDNCLCDCHLDDAMICLNCVEKHVEIPLSKNS